MKILHVCKTFYPDTLGGVEHFVRTLSHLTTAKGIDNTVLTVSKNPFTRQESAYRLIKYKTTFEYASCPVSLSLLKSAKKIFDGYDIIQFHCPWPFADLLALQSQCQKKAKIIVTYQSDVVKQKYLKILYQPLQRRFLKLADCIVGTTDNLVKNSDNLKLFPEKLRNIPLTILPEQYQLEDKKLLGKWQDQVGKDFLLFIGQFRYYKGLNYLIDALEKTPAVRLVLVGSGVIENELREKIKAQQLEDRVYFTGSVSDQDKLALLTLCKALVLPACERSEAFGICLLEAMLFKKPMISTELGTGTSYVNLHQQSGLVVEPKNAAALASAINQLWSDPALTKQYGDNAYNRFYTHFSPDVVSEQYIRLYEDLCL